MTPEDRQRLVAGTSKLSADLQRLEAAHRAVAEAWREESLGVSVAFFMLGEAYAVARETLEKWADKEEVDT